MRGRRRWAQISHFGKLGGGFCEKTRRRRVKGKNPKELKLLSLSLSLILLEPNGEEGRGLALL